jgi:hypothetical protein
MIDVLGGIGHVLTGATLPAEDGRAGESGISTVGASAQA